LSLSNAKTNWIQIGCSGQSVPSLSNTAMRWVGCTKSDVPSVVTRLTKSTKRPFAAHSFQEGSGSVGTISNRLAGRPHRSYKFHVLQWNLGSPHPSPPL